jgi:hypothetical protein
MADGRKVVIAEPPLPNEYSSMKNLRVMLAAVLLAAVLGSMAPARSSQDNPKPVQAPNLTSLHDFDFRAGRWQAHHRRLKERLANDYEWVEFDGTQTFWKLLDGWANADENVFKMPGGDYRGVSLRAYDPITREWAIWWLDGRNHFSELDPPVKGRFKNGVGTFYANDTLRGKPTRVRFVWSRITSTSAHWELAFSPDGGRGGRRIGSRTSGGLNDEPRATGSSSGTASQD